MSGRLERSRSNRVIGGVCGGLADYLDIDATIVRVAMVILGSFGIGILIYFVLLVLMPNPGQPSPFIRSSATGEPGAEELSSASAPARVVDPTEVDRRRSSLGILLVAVGAIFMLGNLGAFRFVQWSVIWPLVLIALGVFFIAQRTRR